MPGIVMETSEPTRSESGSGLDARNGIAQQPTQGSSSKANHASQSGSGHMGNGLERSNGIESGNDEIHENGAVSEMEWDRTADAHETASSGQWPPEIPHVPPEGFFSLSTMISRVAQKSLIDLTQVIEEMAARDVTIENSPSNSTYGHGYTNGTALGNQSEANLFKKNRLFNFALDKRRQLIKLLVISAWGRGAADVAKAIDIKVWINQQLELYDRAVWEIGEMKRMLATEKVPPPDLDTALEVLSTGKVASLPDLGLLPQKPLSTKKILKILRRINVLLAIKIILLDKDQFPEAFMDYWIQDGRVTFKVPSEFELDLSIADEEQSSQFYFVDMRLLFSPSSPIAEGSLRAQIEWKANEVLRTGGLPGCFTYLHNFIMTTKIGALGSMASMMSRTSWTETLRVDYLHRTLVVQYWTSKLGPKSWIEIGIQSGRRKDSKRFTYPGVPYLDVRWLREKQEVDNSRITFDTGNLNLEATLRSVIALHISHMLKAMYDKLMEGDMYQAGKMGAKLTTSHTEPSDCQLAIQLTKTKILKIMIEPTSGRVVFQPPSQNFRNFEARLNASRDLAKEGGFLLAQLRCFVVKDEVEYRARLIGWEVQHAFAIPDAEKTRAFPKDTVSFACLRQKSWRPGWHLFSTHGFSGDVWWIVQMKSEMRASRESNSPVSVGVGLLSVQAIDSKYLDPPSSKLSFSYFKKLAHISSGLISLQANDLGLEKLRVSHQIIPTVKAIGSDLPYILIHFDSRKLPSLLPKLKGTGDSWCDNSIRLSFQGLDPLTAKARILAQGHLLPQYRYLTSLNNVVEKMLFYNPRSRLFAVELPDFPGAVVGQRLLKCLQQFERLIRVLSALKSYHFEPHQFSLGSVLFHYAGNLRGRMIFDQPKPEPSKVPPQIAHLFKTDPSKKEDYAYTVLEFPKTSPHYRVRWHLMAIFNRGGGLHDVAKLLTVTLPAIYGLREIERTHFATPADQSTQPSTSVPSDVSQIIAKALPEAVVYFRFADNFSLTYHVTTPSSGENVADSSAKNPPSWQTRKLITFSLQLQPRRDKVLWMVTNGGNEREKEIQTEIGLTAVLKEKIFSSRGPGWTGMETGVVCNIMDDSDQSIGYGADDIKAAKENGEEGGIVGLLKTLDNVITEFKVNWVQTQSKGGKPIKNQNKTQGRSGGQNAGTKGNKNGKGKGTGGDEDVIMIN